MARRISGPYSGGKRFSMVCRYRTATSSICEGTENPLSEARASACATCTVRNGHDGRPRCQKPQPPSPFCIPRSRSMSRFIDASIASAEGSPSASNAPSTSLSAATLRIRELTCSAQSKG